MNMLEYHGGVRITGRLSMLSHGGREEEDLKRSSLRAALQTGNFKILLKRKEGRKDHFALGLILLLLDNTPANL